MKAGEIIKKVVKYTLFSLFGLMAAFVGFIAVLMIQDKIEERKAIK